MKPVTHLDALDFTLGRMRVLRNDAEDNAEGDSRFADEYYYLAEVVKRLEELREKEAEGK